MSTFVTFPVKFVAEDIFLDFDFISDLDTGETISSSTVTASTFSGDDATPENIISGADTVSGDIVTQKIIDGTAGVIYLITCTIGTSAGATKIMQGYLAVISTNPF